MITHSAWNDKNTNTYNVEFYFKPQSVTCSRNNFTATHVGGGTKWRDQWEGVYAFAIYSRNRSKTSDWKYEGTELEKIKLSTTKNGEIFDVKVQYRIWTMGYHWQCTNGELPFFYYGNIGGKENKYSHGYFTDSAPVPPSSNFHNIHAVVPTDWKYVTCWWSLWAYNHAKKSDNWQKDPGQYEQRNGNKVPATSSNGWISDSNLKQAYRKGCVFVFEKVYTQSVTSSGIITDASTPEVTVTPIKGDKGEVSIKYVDKYNTKGQLWLRAYCKDKHVDILQYDNNAWFTNGQSKQVTVDFVETFGESYRGNDITYEGWSRNYGMKESSGTGKKGGHRFNGRPTVPTGLAVAGKNDLIYDNITFSWKASSDPDGDTISYNLWLAVDTPEGKRVKDEVIAKNISGLTYNYNIANDSEQTKYIFWVQASDGLIESEWSAYVAFEKGSKPKPPEPEPEPAPPPPPPPPEPEPEPEPAPPPPPPPPPPSGDLVLLSPEVNGANLYSVRPRFVFDGYDGKSIMVVEFNNREYNSQDDSDRFAFDGSKVMFCIRNSSESIKIRAYMKNESGTSEKSAEYNFRFVSITSNIMQGEYSKATTIQEFSKFLEDKVKAYNVSFSLGEITANQTFLNKKYYNVFYNGLKEIDDRIDSLMKINKFSTYMESEKISSGTINEEALWNNLFNDITYI